MPRNTEHSLSWKGCYAATALLINSLMLEVREWLKKMQFHYLWGSKQLMDKIGGRLKQAVLFFVSTVEKKPRWRHKLFTMKKKRTARDSE